MQTIEIGRPPIYVFSDGRTVELPKHREFQESRAKRKIFVVHRRGRKTSMALEEMFKYLVANPKIIGKTLAPIRKQAKEIIFDDPGMLFTIVPKQIIQRVDNGALQVWLKNGSIWYLDGADDPNFQRGGNVKILHLTEAGDHKEEVWNSVYEPVLTLNGGVAIFEGNPRGQNWFFRLFQNVPDRRGWVRWIVPASETPIFTVEQLADIKANNPENVFAAEYLCEWVGSIGTVFRSIRGISIYEPQTAQENRRYRIGIDLAKVQDFTVISVVDKHNWKQVWLERFNQLDWTLQKERMKEVIKNYSKKINFNEVEVLIESNGIGDPIYDDLCVWVVREREHNIIIRPFKTTNASKSLLITNMSMLSDQGIIGLLKDEKQISEFEAFTYKKTATNFIYGAPEGLHDDIVMATAFSFWELGGKYPVPQEITAEERFTRLLKQKNSGKLDLSLNYYANK